MEEVAVQLEAIAKELASINSTLWIYGAMLIGALVCIALKDIKVVVNKPTEEADAPPKEFGL